MERSAFSLCRRLGMKARNRNLEKLQDWKGWIEEFQNESDRAAAILGAAVLDALLEELLREFLVDDPGVVSKLLSTEQPLGSFGSRGLAAYCMGLVSKGQYEDLRTVGKIRNRFAHDLHGIDFEDDSVRDLCRNLLAGKTLLPERQLDTRSCYILTVSDLAGWLALNRLGIGDNRRVERPAPQIVR
jgi:DNA-binding MltR family transcriptional regulator